MLNVKSNRQGWINVKYNNIDKKDVYVAWHHIFTHQKYVFCIINS